MEGKKKIKEGKRLKKKIEQLQETLDKQRKKNTKRGANV